MILEAARQRRMNNGWTGIYFIRSHMHMSMNIAADVHVCVCWSHVISLKESSNQMGLP